jgi:hypothetical protein
MNLLKFTIVISIFLFVSSLCEAQVALAVAKEKDSPYSCIEWRVEWGYGDYSEAGRQAVKYLENKGYKSVYNQLLDPKFFYIDNGYWVVIKTQYKSYGKTMVSFGLGVSANSLTEAEANAVANLKSSDWNWKPSSGYTTEQTGFFSNTGQKQFIYIIKKRKTPCGENAYDISYMLGTYDNAFYAKIYRTMMKQNNSENPVISQVGHIVNKAGFVGILKSKQVCQDGSTVCSYKVVEAATPEEIRSAAPYDRETISSPGQPKFFVNQIVELGKDRECSLLRENFDLFNKTLGVENKQILNEWGSGGVRD